MRMPDYLRQLARRWLTLSKTAVEPELIEDAGLGLRLGGWGRSSGASRSRARTAHWEDWDAVL